MARVIKPIFDDKYFKSDEIVNGRVIRRFLKELIEKVFKKAHRYWQANYDLTEICEFPLLYDERNLYSIFAAAIDEITPVHLSEWSFNKADTGIDSRRVDFWCLNKCGENGKVINYFIELKKNGYCLSKGTEAEFTSAASKDVKGITDQIVKLKKIRPNWNGHDEVYLGIIVVHAYCSANREPEYDEQQIRDNIYKLMDKRSKAQLLFSTLTLPSYMGVHWETDICRFVAIAGVAITKSRPMK